MHDGILTGLLPSTLSGSATAASRSPAVISPADVSPAVSPSLAVTRIPHPANTNGSTKFGNTENIGNSGREDAYEYTDDFEWENNQEQTPEQTPEQTTEQTPEQTSGSPAGGESAPEALS